MSQKDHKTRRQFKFKMIEAKHGVNFLTKITKIGPDQYSYKFVIFRLIIHSCYCETNKQLPWLDFTVSGLNIFSFQTVQDTREIAKFCIQFWKHEPRFRRPLTFTANNYLLHIYQNEW